MIVLSALCLAYLLGSIPTGLLVGRLRGIDVRKHGSGNVGATNVARVVGKLPGLFVLIVDAAKGYVPVTLIASKAVAMEAGWPAENLRILLGVVAVAGHIWNPFLQFKGGRGVATGLGVLLGLDGRVGVGSLLVWLIVVFLTKYVSIASISAAVASCFLMALLGHSVLWVWGAIAVALVILWRHRPNLLRLLQGEEPKISSKS